MSNFWGKISTHFDRLEAQGQETIETDQKLIREGKAWSITKTFDVVAGQTKYFLLETGNAYNRLKPITITITAGYAEIEVYAETNKVRDDAKILTATNHNFSIDTQPQTVVSEDPIGEGDGINKKYHLVVGGSGGPITLGGIMKTDKEFILDVNSKYLWKIIPSVDCKINIDFFFIEEGDFW